MTMKMSTRFTCGAPISGIPVMTSVMIVILIMVAMSVTIRAEIATDLEMNQVCRNWLAQAVTLHGDWASTGNPEIITATEITSGDVILARIYHISPRGFVIVPALKEMQPVKAYSDESNLDDLQDGGFIEMLTEILTERTTLYEQRFGSLEAAQPVDGEALFGQGQRALWNTYTKPTSEFLASRDAAKTALLEAGPLLTSSWHQRTPYNNLCPMGDGDRTVVGCVATATAQILNYWQWPPTGTGSHSYTWSGDQSCEGSTPSEVLSADYSDEYDWTHIIDSCDDGCASLDSAALAELCYETGVAFGMNYGACGSGAATANAVSVFPTYFKYSTDIHLENRIDYDLDGWFGLARDEIDLARPIQYRIRSHSIVCDGYREMPDHYEYHMNYGWGGSFTAWFVLDSLYCYWVEPDSVCPADEEFMIINIEPEESPNLSIIARSFLETTGDGDGHADPSEEIDLTVSIINSGLKALGTTGELTTNDPNISITAPFASFEPSIEWGDQGVTQTPFHIVIDGSCPDPRVVLFELTLSANGGYAAVDTVLLFVGDTRGFLDDMDGTYLYWRHTNISPAHSDQWHLETNRAYSGSTSWKVGGFGADNYDDLLDAGLVTPPFLLPDHAELTFHHWMSAEIKDAEEAWDGGIVMISNGDGNWTQLTPGGEYPYTMAPNDASPFDPGTPCFSGSVDWEAVTFDLSSWSGVVQIMFRFGSDGYTTEEGWYIDNVEVYETFLCGDANADGTADIGDAIYIINYVFKNGPAPVPPQAADVNCDGNTNVADAVYLINYIFKSGPAPCAACP